MKTAVLCNGFISHEALLHSKVTAVAASYNSAYTCFLFSSSFRRAFLLPTTKFSLSSMSSNHRALLPSARKLSQGRSAEVARSFADVRETETDPNHELAAQRGDPSNIICFWWYHDRDCRAIRERRTCPLQHAIADGLSVTAPPGFFHFEPCFLPLCPLRVRKLVPAYEDEQPVTNGGTFSHSSKEQSPRPFKRPNGPWK